MEKITIRDEYIRLGQAMKLGGMVSSGTDAKFLIRDGEVLVNGGICLMRGKKLYPGDQITYDGQTMEIARAE